MAPRGTLSKVGPDACPFVALELDRDRRSERPDYRHRCYAEQVPAPRTVAHQERFCLSPNFSGCPIFQDWAVRAAARPVPLPQGYEGGRRATPDPRADVAAGLAGAAGAPGTAQISMSGSESIPPAAEPAAGPPAADEPDEGWPDSMAAFVPDGAATAAAGALMTEPIAEEQLSAFDAPPIDSVAPAAPPAAASPRYTPPADRVVREMNDETGADPVDLEEPDGAVVPAFLASRSTRPRPSPKTDDRVQREDVVPSWEIDGRFGAQAGGESRVNGVFSRLLTIVAVVIILALGVAAVILVPGLLAGSPQETARPSFATVPSRLPSAAASGLAVLPTPTGLPLPTASANAEPSPRLHKIKSGDTLAKIAKKFDVTVADILAANPQIPDANHIEVGQFIVIPPPAATPAP